MQHKYGKFYADWRDSTGRRHRAAFATKAEAIKHQTGMREAARPSPPLAPSRTQRRSSSKRTRTTQTPKRHSQPRHRSSAKSKRAASRRSMSRQ